MEWDSIGDGRGERTADRRLLVDSGKGEEGIGEVDWAAVMVKTGVAGSATRGGEVGRSGGRETTGDSVIWANRSMEGVRLWTGREEGV